jgi:hypothetical protein
MSKLVPLVVLVAVRPRHRSSLVRRDRHPLEPRGRRLAARRPRRLRRHRFKVKDAASHSGDAPPGAPGDAARPRARDPLSRRPHAGPPSARPSHGRGSCTPCGAPFGVSWKCPLLGVSQDWGPQEGANVAALWIYCGLRTEHPVSGPAYTHPVPTKFFLPFPPSRDTRLPAARNGGPRSDTCMSFLSRRRGTREQPRRQRGHQAWPDPRRRDS